MQRRKFLSSLTAGALATALAGCGKDRASAGGDAPAARSGTIHRWKMVTTWPPGFPGAGTGAERLARNIHQMSGGRIEIRVFGADELVPAFEVFEAVQSGTAQMGHGAAYYWKGKAPAAQYFSAVPFGMSVQEMYAWLYQGGGLDLWRELYADFGLVPFAAGNTGVQMGGWFNREIRSAADLEGLKMRIPGLGGEVLRRAGGLPQTLPGAEIFTAMQTGSIDATEWIGPYNDMSFGLHKVAKYYYYPGWHEGGSVLEAIVNADAFAALGEDLQAIVREACRAANVDFLAEYTARNAEALSTLVNEHGVDLRPFPEAVLTRLRSLAGEVIGELAASDATVARVDESYRQFQRSVADWTRISEQAFLSARS